MKQYLVKPETKVKLSKWDPNDTGDFKGGKEEGLGRTRKTEWQTGSIAGIVVCRAQTQSAGRLTGYGYRRKGWRDPPCI